MVPDEGLEPPELKASDLQSEPLPVTGYSGKMAGPMGLAPTSSRVTSGCIDYFYFDPTNKKPFAMEGLVY